MPYAILKEEDYANFGGINEKASKYITGVHELLRLQNGGFSKLGSITTVPGYSAYLGATLPGRLTGVYEYTRLSGSSYQIVSCDTNVYRVNGGAYTSIRSNLTNNLLFDFVTFVDWLFACNGSEIFKFDGTNATNFSLPPGLTLTATAGASNGTGFSGVFQYAYGYLNSRGYYGPAINIGTLNGEGATQVTLSGGFTTPSGFGISAIVIYRTDADSNNLFQIGTMAPNLTSFIDTNLPLGTRAAPTYLYFTLAPKFMELYNNQIFYAGFSSALSTSYYSDIGEPEGIGSTAFFEVRTNDGDKLTCLKTFQTSLLFFKQKSFHQLTGDRPSQFNLDEKSTDYGALNNRCAVTFKNRCWFLDVKGIAEFNGANTQIVSEKMEETFMAMNLEAAIEHAWMAHDKARNEILCAIPINGSTVNNIVVIYDYVAEAWRTDTNVQAVSFAIMRANFNRDTPFFGGYSGVLIYQGVTAQFMANGQAATLVMMTRFFAPEGHATEDVFRRLFLDVDPIQGQTLPILVRFYKNMGTSAAVLERTMYMTQYQQRLEFGISARDIAIEFIYSQSTPLRINGFTIGRRFLRDI